MAFTFKLVQVDGTPADPPSLDTAVPTWRSGDTIALGRDRILRVIESRPGNLTKTQCWWSKPPRRNPSERPPLKHQAARRSGGSKARFCSSLPCSSAHVRWKVATARSR